MGLINKIKRLAELLKSIKVKIEYNKPTSSHKNKNLKNKLNLSHYDNNYKKGTNETDKEGDGSSSGSVGKLQGQGFVDPKAATSVKDPATILYDEIINDPEALIALQKLINSNNKQIPVSDITAEFNKIKNSTVALETVLNSPLTPSDIKAKARDELNKRKAELDRAKNQAQPGFKPGGPNR